MANDAQNTSPLVVMENIVKTFGRVTALEGVDFEVGRTEVMALLGDNGAGKSTLIKILTGIYTPTSGRIMFDGQEVEIHNSHQARELGIETVYQDLALVNTMSIGRNFFLGREPVRRVGPVPWLDMKYIAEQTRVSLADIGINIRSANDKVGKLSGGERQSITIGRAIHFGVKLSSMSRRRPFRWLKRVKCWNILSTPKRGDCRSFSSLITSTT